MQKKGSIAAAQNRKFASKSCFTHSVFVCLERLFYESEILDGGEAPLCRVIG